MTNQFTDEQVEAAAKAYWLASEREIHDKPITWEWDKEERRRYMWAARQVLAGVTPQAASERTPEFESREQELFKHQPVLSMKDGGIAGCKCMDRVFYNQAEDWGTHLAEVFDALAAAVVQPSSTVDEGKLAEVIAKAGLDYNLSDRSGESYACGAPDYRSVYIARAVVEAIGGESRGE